MSKWQVSKKEERLGTEKYNSQGCLMRVEEYDSSNDLLVRFLDTHNALVHAAWREFEQGRIINPFFPTVYGFGYMGEGPFGSHDKPYKFWSHALERSYSPLYKSKFPTYENCIVSEEWRNYQNFGYWFKENFYEVPSKRMELDKDLFYLGNKEYGPLKCCFLPNDINSIYKTTDGTISRNIRFRSGKYEVTGAFEGKKYYLGGFTTFREATQGYLDYKYSRLLEKRKVYSSFLPQRVYDTLGQWREVMEKYFEWEESQWKP